MCNEITKQTNVQLGNNSSECLTLKRFLFILHNQMNCWIPNNSKRKDSLFLMFSRLKLWQHKVEALTRWYDHDLDVFSKPIEQDILQDLRC